MDGMGLGPPADSAAMPAFQPQNEEVRMNRPKRGFATTIPVILALLCYVLSFSTVFGDELVTGKKLFEGKCARCHAKDATGNPKMLKLLNVTRDKINLHRDEVVRMSVFQIETMVDSGKHRMPNYRGKLTDDQIHEVALYLKSLIGEGNPDESVTAK